MDSAAGDETSEFRLSQNLGDARTRWNKDQFEKSVSVVETGKVIFTEKKTAQTASEADHWNNAESGKSESSVDV